MWCRIRLRNSLVIFRYSGMNALSLAEENYLKAIYALSAGGDSVSTRSIALHLDAKDSSVTDMLKKLAAKGLLNYVRYHGVTLTDAGKQSALVVIRRHRLWEVFLVQKLGFRWDEVHHLAEQLEHIQSPKLMERMDHFLGRPRVDPHGDPIPDQHGHIQQRSQTLLADAACGVRLQISRVKDDSPEFLQYLDATGLQIGEFLVVTDRIAYDDSLALRLEAGKDIHISQKVSRQILVAET